MNRAEQLRLDRGLSQQVAAERAGISLPTVRRIERGELVVARSLHALGTFYGVRPSSLQQPAVFDEVEVAA
jgi:transcriptional regulator with XRE-family HTH domain